MLHNARSLQRSESQASPSCLQPWKRAPPLAAPLCLLLLVQKVANAIVRPVRLCRQPWRHSRGPQPRPYAGFDLSICCKMLDELSTHNQWPRFNIGPDPCAVQLPIFLDLSTLKEKRDLRIYCEQWMKA